MKLSVIIVNYNVQYFIEQCLHSVLKAAHGIALEVIVVDNNSVDGSVAMIAQKFPQVTLIGNKENTGFSKANNQGIKLSKGEYVLLLNPDTLVEEDTFEKVIRFMDAHPDAGGLGVYMIDGKGNFLPESKRGLPTPSVAFYKIFGLSALFPKSTTFGKYHLGYLDKNKTHEVEILSGAFLLLRKSVVDKIGLLDETFFMYGEDIDLSYRILKAGYKNYYFPETRIIHYKGESTKKSSVNYVFVFYRAMIIFAQKHFSKQNAEVFSWLINMAVYLRAAMAVVARFMRNIAAPATDSLFMYAGYIILKIYWEDKIKVFDYPSFYETIIIPCYVLIWLTGIFLSGGYDKPVNYIKLIRGVFYGTLSILVVYALLPEDMRYSRALIMLGTLWAAASIVSYRWLFQLFKLPFFTYNSSIKKRIAIVASNKECQRILQLLTGTGSNYQFIGQIFSVGENEGHDENYLGSTDRLNDLCQVYQVDELVFSSKDIAAHQIIELMQKNLNPKIEFKIAPEQSSYIIGSNSIHEQGKLYLVDMNTLSHPENVRNKRIFDFGLAFLLLLTMPICVWFIRNKWGFIKNAIAVWMGKYSWVGLTETMQSKNTLTKPGVLTPADASATVIADKDTLERLNILYARNFSVSEDFNLVVKNFKNLGRSISKISES
ncbi:MAG: glycosyltransferase [Bacteroidetes bacterium]|nr:glycosyltransferase [Bacteroidota bacterium]